MSGARRWDYATVLIDNIDTKRFEDGGFKSEISAQITKWAEEDWELVCLNDQAFYGYVHIVFRRPHRNDASQ
ncbi:MAG TPA: hypothetical protein VFB54_17455 [Burkholderiales bacterium]|nr:hypothetical protein [Burkholderiales bacterium]